MFGMFSICHQALHPKTIIKKQEEQGEMAIRAFASCFTTRLIG
jgi:hypothetical protein